VVRASLEQRSGKRGDDSGWKRARLSNRELAEALVVDPSAVTRRLEEARGGDPRNG
jgi:hypothetical protein